MIELIVAIHITLELSNTIAENVHDAGDVIAYGTKGTPPLTPIDNVPPERGEKYPFGMVLRLAIDAIPPVVATYSPPSEEIAMPRPEPTTARLVGTSPFIPKVTTCTP